MIIAGLVLAFVAGALVGREIVVRDTSNMVEQLSRQAKEELVGILRKGRGYE